MLHETQGQPGGHLWSGRTLRSTHAGVTKSFAFPGDLPSAATGGKRVLAASAGLAALGIIAPDFVLPNGFLPTDGGTLEFAGVDQVAYGGAAGRRRQRDHAAGFRDAERRGELRGRHRLRAGVAGDGDRVPARGTRPLLHRQPAARPRRARQRAHRRLVAHRPVVQGVPDAGERWRWRQPVCRFYIPPAHGDSHFFSASPAECATIAQKALTDPAYSGYVLESSAAFYVALPDVATGACPPGTAPVYRLWNQRADSNHRYTTDAAVKAQMTAQGYVAEGYGPDAVAMCAPPGTATLKVVAGAAAPYGVLVSDGASTPAANFQGFTTITDSVNVGPRSGSGEVIAFGVERPPTIRPSSWATAVADQLVTVPLLPRLEIPVTIWVVAGPFATTQQTALTLWQTAQVHFTNERLGRADERARGRRRDGQPERGRVDARSRAAPATRTSRRCRARSARAPAASTSTWSRWSTGRRRAATCARSAAGSRRSPPARARNCSRTNWGTTSRSSTWTTSSRSSTPTNIMHSASNVRQYLTEGQTFRAHVRSNSALNGVYGLRSGLPVRDCDRDTPTLACPAIHRRLWADGAFAPN